MERIDKHNVFRATLNALGFQVSEREAELLLQAVKLFEKKDNQISLQDLLTLKVETYGLMGVGYEDLSKIKL